MSYDDAADLDCNSAEYWSQLYQNGEHRWDLRGETAVFSGLRKTHPIFTTTTPERLSVIIPGCGYGHDAIAFAKAGFPTTAVDFAHEPVQYLRDLAQQHEVPLTVLERDMFTLGWDLAQSFDCVIEYVFYCAIDPSRRAEYVLVLATITKPGGHVIGLFYPIDDVVRDGGPPFSVNEEEVHRQFEEAGFVLVSSTVPRESHPARVGRERLMIFRKPV